MASFFGRLGDKMHTVLRLKASTSQKIHLRFLNLLEYQSKKLLADNGLAVQRFKIVDDVAQAQQVSKDFKVKEYVIKAQILAGGRGLGVFDNGFKGGVQLTQDSAQVPKLVEKMVGHRLITKQTPKSGILVQKVMVAESVTIQRETYVAILMDREKNGPVLMCSPDGGMDIEEVAAKTPERIQLQPVDIFQGLTVEQARSAAEFLGFKGAQLEAASNQILGLYQMFLKVDATQIEINPLAETSEGQIVCVDAKINFDDNAAYRQKAIFDIEDTSETDSREVEASKYNLNYIGMDGNIACLVNGAGLAMATMDLIKLHGGVPANFLDVGGNVREEQVYQAFRILTSDKRVRAILVNVFGGIVNCATIAKGIINACKSIKLQIPLIVRLEGTNVEEAKRMLLESRLEITSAENLDDAARKAVSSIRQ